MDQAGTIFASAYTETPVVAPEATTAVYLSRIVAPPVNNFGQDPGAIIIRNFQEYKLHSYRITWTPMIGSTTPGAIYMGFYDNPEVGYKAISGIYSGGQLGSLAQQARNMVSGPIWKELTLDVPMATRRKRYACNGQAPTSREAFDLEAHGVVIIAIIGLSGDVQDLGTLSPRYKVEGFEIVNNAVAEV